MQCGSKACNQRGRIDKLHGSFRAHVQYYDAISKKTKHICGPRRCFQAEAEDDLEKIRGAAQHDERHRDLDAMASEAMRLKNNRAMVEKDRSLSQLLMLMLQLL